MVQYLHFRILEFPLNSWGWTMAMAFGFYHGLPTWCCWFHWRTDRMAVLEVTLLLRKFCLKRPTEEVQNRINQKKQGLTQNLGFNGIFQWDFSQQIWRFNGILNIKPGIPRVVILFLSSRSRGSSKSPWDIYVYIHININLIFMHCSKLPLCYECVWKWGNPTSPKWYLLNIRVRLILEGIITSILLLFSWGRWW